MSVMELSTSLISNKAHQPHKFQMPQREFGKTFKVKHLFQRSIGPNRLCWHIFNIIGTIKHPQHNR